MATPMTLDLLNETLAPIAVYAEKSILGVNVCIHDDHVIFLDKEGVAALHAYCQATWPDEIPRVAHD